MIHRCALITGLSLSLVTGLTAQAQPPAVQNRWLLCEPDILTELITPATGAGKDAPLELNADTGQSSPTAAVLQGSVVAKQGDQQLQASHVTLDRQRNRLSARGPVNYGSPDLAARTTGPAEVDLNTETGEFGKAEFYVPSRNAQGSAQSVDFQYRERTAQLREATYSTCRRGNEFWQLRTSQLDLNQQTGRGEATHLTLALGDVPLLYFPYLSFPINDERQSGFLTPSFGYGTLSGFELRLPFYWNIAPNQDMTISPRVFTKRGVMLGTEYRFLTPKGSGEIDLEYLPHDRVLDENRTGVYVSGQSNPLQNVYANLLVQYVSDDEYLNDLHNKLDLLSDTYLERHLDLLYQGSNWSTLARVQNYQVLDEGTFSDEDDPYDRLPQLLFEGRWPGLSYGLGGRMRGEVVNFEHGRKVTGSRLDLWPALSWPWQTPAGFLIPQVGYRLTAYNLNDTTTTYPDTPTRRVPLLSLDSGLFFDRPIAWPWWNEQLDTLTLEPRLFYLYVPYRNQTELPRFDTTLLSPSYSRLFLENRFTGADRLNDANQITTGVTSRLLSSNSGYEQFRVSAGQIYYFQDRQVTLRNTESQDNSRSDLITEGLVNLRRDLALSGNVQWDIGGAGIRRSGLNVRYRPTSDRLINVAYRLTQHLISEEAPEESEIKQIDVSTLWALSDRWRTVARWNYSLDTSRNLDTFAGLEYEECCWALRVMARRYRDEPDSELEQAYFIELELKGLSQVGNKRITRFLEEAIQGYQPRSVYSPFTSP